MTAEILSVGSYVPEKVITNDELPASLETSDQWIREHTGIGQRHIIDEGQTTSDLALEASRVALDRAGLTPDDLDMIVVATASADYIGFPATACVLQAKLGTRKPGAMDLAAGCTGFVYALEVARGLILSGSMKKVLVVGVEALTRITNWKDRNTAVLFGDGAGAVVMGANESGDGRGVLDSILRAEGEGAEYLIRKAGGANHPYKEGETAPEDLYISMNGRRVYGFAVRVNETIIKTLMERNNLSFDDIDRIVPHQANLRIIQAAAKRLELPLEKFFVNIENYANTSAASIPIALDTMTSRGELKRGDLFMTAGFGAGLTFGGNLIRW